MPQPRSVAASDNFNRPNGGLGSNWIATPGSTNFLQIIGNQVTGPNAQIGSVFWNPATNAFTNDQSSSVLLDSLNLDHAGLVVRHSPSVNSYYSAFLHSTNGILFNKMVAGTPATILTTGTPHGFTAGDIFTLEVVGSLLRVLKNGVPVPGAAVTDTALTSGQPGLRILYDQCRVDDWEGTNGAYEPPTTTTTIPPSTTPAPTFANARRQICMDQEPGGKHYPFILPSDDLDQLIADFYLSYRDDLCDAVMPLHIAWLWNFGTIENAASEDGFVHEYELLIADDSEGIVFDSRDADGFTVTAWGDDKKIIEWANTATGEVCRVVIYTAWSPDQTPIVWNKFLEPEDSRLDGRTYERRILGVTSLMVDTNDGGHVEIPAGSNIIFKAGYNYGISVGNAEATDGGVLRYVVGMSVAPGTGIGKFPGCEVEKVPLHKINGVTADESGNLAFDMKQCYYTGLKPTAIAGDMVTVQPAALVMSNNCGPCYTCDDFVLVYNAIRRLYQRYKALGVRAEAVRDLLVDNINRWNDNRECRRGHVLRSSMMQLGGCRMGMSAAVCNNSDGPLQNVTLKLKIKTTAGGLCLVCNSVFRRGNVDPTKPYSAAQFEPYALGGTFPGNAEAHFDCINPGELGAVVFQVEAQDATDSDTITIDISATAGVLASPTSQTTGVRCSSLSKPVCCETGTTTSTTPSLAMLASAKPKTAAGPIAKLIADASGAILLAMPYGFFDHLLHEGDEVNISDTTLPVYTGKHRVAQVLSSKIVRLATPFAGDAIGGHWFKV